MKEILIILISLFALSLQAQEEAQKAFNEGMRLLKANKFEEAEKQFSIAIETGKTKEGLKMSYIYKGFSLNGQKKYDEAISDFTSAIEIDPTDAASFTDRALAYSYKQDYENAIIDFEKVLSIDSKDDQAEAAYYHLGRIKFAYGEFEEAIKYFDELIELVPTDAESYFLRGTAKSNLMLIEESIEDFDLAIKNKPNYMQAYTNRAFQKINALTRNGNISPTREETKSACEDFKKGMELGDKKYDLYEIHCTDSLNKIKKKSKKKKKN